MNSGTSNPLVLGLTLARNSLDNPLYTRSGSVVLTQPPPYPAGISSGKKNWGRLADIANYPDVKTAEREAAPRKQLYHWDRNCASSLVHTRWQTLTASSPVP